VARRALVSCRIALFEATVTANEGEAADTIIGDVEDDLEIPHGVIEIAEFKGRDCRTIPSSERGTTNYMRCSA
jgi:hypothetical protein